MIFQSNALADRHILVTGGSSGIGRATAVMLAEAGARVTVSGRNPQRLEETLTRLSGDGHRSLPANLDSVESGHDLATAAAKASGALDGIFHAAGEAGLRSSKMLTSDHVAALFGSSVQAAFGLAKAGAKRNVTADGASLVFMSSVAGVRGRAGMAAYSAAKAAIGGLTRSLAAELAPRTVRVNEIIAGAVETEMHEQITQGLDESGQDDYRNLHMLGFGKPDDIGSAVVFLMSPAARWITGASLAVDGGYTAK